MQKIAIEIANDEIAHVDLLRAALGDAAVPCPLVDIGSAFAAAADAAFGTTLSPPFSPYSNDVTFLLGAFIFEDVGTYLICVSSTCAYNNQTLRVVVAAGSAFRNKHVCEVPFCCCFTLAARRRVLQMRCICYCARC